MNPFFLQAQQQSPVPTIIMMVGMVVVMYFFLLRPQKKRADAQKKFGETINSGEQVVTTSGIHARINRINEDNTLQLEISRGVFITVDRSAVSMELTNAMRSRTGAASEPSK